MENMHILLVRVSRERFPYGTAEITPPVAGKFSLFPVLDIEKIAVFSIWSFTGFFKPFMLVGTVVYHQVHQDIHLTFICLSDQFVHIFHSTESRINIIIIGNVISLVCKGGRIDRGNPQDIHA